MRNIKLKLGSGTLDSYNPVSLGKNYTTDELKAEYTRLRENMRKTVDRIAKSGEFPDAAIVDAYKWFAPASQYDHKGLAMQLSRISGVMSANTATITGLREQRNRVLDTLQSRGYTGITKKNFGAFTNFMESTRALALSILAYRYTRRGKAAGADRNKRLELFETAQRIGITEKSLIKDFKFYVQHLDQLKQLPDHSGGRLLGIKSIRARLKEQ